MTLSFATYSPHPFSEEKLFALLKRSGHSARKVQRPISLNRRLIKPLTESPSPPLLGDYIPKAGVAGFELCQQLKRTFPTPLLFLTGLYLLTYEEEDHRDHGRTFVVFDDVLCISTWGILEAPAKSSLFYLSFQGKIAQGASEEEAYLAAHALSPALRPNTPLFEKALGFTLLQALLFYQTLLPPCTQKKCLLYIARRQEDLLEQVEAGFPLCPQHAHLLRL